MIGKLLWHEARITQVNGDAIEIVVPYVRVQNDPDFVEAMDNALMKLLKRKKLAVNHRTIVTLQDDVEGRRAARVVISGLSEGEVVMYAAHGCALALRRKSRANRKPKSGEMTEYGWYDQELEDEIEKAISEYKLQREDAIVKVFNEA